jgi:hypothetical protein
MTNKGPKDERTDSSNDLPTQYIPASLRISNVRAVTPKERVDHDTS